jgi:hypothetical protein
VSSLYSRFVGTNESDERIAEKKIVFAIIEAPRHLVEIGLQVFRGDSMPRTHNPALEKLEGNSTVSPIPIYSG